MLCAWRRCLPGKENKYSSVLFNRGKLSKCRTRQRVSITGISRMGNHLKVLLCPELWAGPWAYRYASFGRSRQFFLLIFIRDWHSTCRVQGAVVWLKAIHAMPELAQGGGRRTSASWSGAFSIPLRGDFEVDWSKEKSRSIILGRRVGTQPAHK